MKIKIIAVGKLKKSPEKELIERYLKICKWKAEIIEVEVKIFSSPEHRRSLEAKEILKNIGEAYIIALDERGETPTSPDFAAMLEKLQDSGKDICFILGGSDGLDETVRQSASRIVSFGHMTLPHMMARAVLCEQIYRAGTIIDGHPYSK